MHKYILIILISIALFTQCTKNEVHTEINHFSIVGQYQGSWQQCSLLDSTLNCNPAYDGIVGVIVFTPTDIIVKHLDTDSEDTLKLVRQDNTLAKPVFHFENIKTTSNSELIYYTEDKALKYCHQMATDSVFIEKCFEGKSF